MNPKVVIGTLTIIIIAASFVLFSLGGKQEGPLTDENVKSIYVHYADGSELNVDPVSEEGEKIIAACNGVLNHMYAQIEGLISREEFEEDKRAKTYVYLELHEFQEVEIRGEYVPEGRKIECDGIYFFFGKHGAGWVMKNPHFVETPEGEYWWPYGWEWTTEGPDFAFPLELKNLIEELRPQHGGNVF